MNDFIIRPFAPADRPALRALWQIVFGDSEDYIDGFFDRFLTPGACVVAEVEGKVVSAMYIIPGVTAYPYRKNTLSAGYTYALATLPEYRGRGIGTAVYKAASDAALQRADAACVLPAESGLYPFYEAAAGARAFSAVREARFQKSELAGISPCMGSRVPALKYAGMREQLLGGMPHVTFPSELFDLMEESGTDFLVLADGLAAAETEDGVCRITELLVPNGNGMAAIASVANWCPADEYIVRSPVFFDGPGEARPLVLAVLKEMPNYPMPDDLWWGFGLE